MTETYSSIVRLVGNDTISINGRLFNDFPHGEVGKVSFSTDLATVKTGKNQNAIFASSESGNQATMELKVLRGSPDDNYLNSLIAVQRSDLPGFTLMSAELAKRLGKGNGTVDPSSGAQTTPGTIISDTYILSGGVFSKQVEVVSNVEGDVEQAVAVYTMQFAKAKRAIA